MPCCSNRAPSRCSTAPARSSTSSPSPRTAGIPRLLHACPASRHHPRQAAGSRCVRKWWSPPTVNNAPLEADGAVRVRCGGVALTLEVFEVATGKTAFTVPFAEVGGIEPTPF